MRSLLLVSRGADLRLVSLDVSYYIDVVLPVNHARIRNAVAADFDPLTGQPPTQLSLSKTNFMLVVIYCVTCCEYAENELQRQ